MIERKIQTEAFWRETFTITQQDVEELARLFIDEGHPLTLTEMTQSLIASYCQREKSLIQRSLVGGTIYRPNGTFSIGEKLVFPHLNFAQGIVKNVREGHNPEYGNFQVIAVEIDKELIYFAAGLQVEHKLAFPDSTTPEDMFVPAAKTLQNQFGDIIKARLETQLRQTNQFVSFQDKWMSTNMMVDVHVGHLNLAEAVLDMQNQPLQPEKLLPDLDLPKEVPIPIKLFSLNYHIAQDERFDDVGSARQITWGLRRWQPETVIMPPSWLDYEPVQYDRTKLDVTHLQLERELDDELSNLTAAPSAAEAHSMTLILPYHHRRLGSLPLTDRTRSFFPAGHLGQRTQITFIDLNRGAEFPGWVVRSHKFVYGLREWYNANQLPVGTYIKLEKTDQPGRVGVDLIPRRMKREWVCTLFKTQSDDLQFQMQKNPVACECDEWSLMEINDQIADELWTSERSKNSSLDEIIQHVFLELAKLSPHGTVHAKALYNAVNIVYRCPPGRIFATLFALPHFVPADEGSWIFNENVY